MVVLIVFLAMIGRLGREYIRSRRWASDQQFTEQQADRIRQLEERVKVLERIVTDKNYDLNEKFRDL
jgi:hypothetical protein